jgi:hypothetical protein
VLQHGLTGLSASANVSKGDPPTSSIAFNEPRYGINEVVSLH